MKKIMSIAIIALVTISSFAQKEQRSRKHTKLTVEQQAELQTKHMTLQLDLSENQQKELFAFNKKNAVERQQKMDARKAVPKSQRKELTSDQLFEQKNKRLDAQIAHQNELKKILSDTQFETWQKTKKQKKHQAKKRINKREGPPKKMRGKRNRKE